ncbi:MAG: hypothetical protein R6U64_02210 [Bacteroidales bacterium]
MQGADLTALEGLTRTWMELRATLAAEQQEWEQQQEHGQRELALLQEARQRPEKHHRGASRGISTGVD